MPSIVDAHHHIWRQQDLPWLLGPMQARIFGPYDAIRRDYPISEYLADLAGLNVTKSVYVQCNWAPAQFEDEVAWVQQVANAHAWPHAIVAYADLLSEDVRPQLERLSRYPLVRGIRMQLHWHANPAYRYAARADVMNDPRFRRNLAHLADFDWLFELQVFTGQMGDAARLARDFPQLPLVLQHAGMLEDTSAEGCQAWRMGMQALAAAPNVHAKLSGLGTFVHRNDPVLIAGIVEQTIDLFGAERCLWGSNFPIEKLWTDYASLLAAHHAALAGRSDTAQALVLHDVASRLYRLEDYAG